MWEYYNNGKFLGLFPLASIVSILEGVDDSCAIMEMILWQNTVSRIWVKVNNAN